MAPVSAASSAISWRANSSRARSSALGEGGRACGDRGGVIAILRREDGGERGVTDNAVRTVARRWFGGRTRRMAVGRRPTGAAAACSTGCPRRAVVTGAAAEFDAATREPASLRWCALRAFVSALSDFVLLPVGLVCAGTDAVPMPDDGVAFTGVSSAAGVSLDAELPAMGVSSREAVDFGEGAATNASTDDVEDGTAAVVEGT